MNTTEEEIIMSHRLSPARQNALLGKCQWSGNRLRVACTHHTEPLLRLAGISRPRACETYLVPAKRDNSGFLVVDTDSRAESAEHGELFSKGGLLEGMQDLEQIAENTRLAAATATEIAETITLITGHGRTFEVSTGPHSKIQCVFIALEDQALPAPNERERWERREAGDPEIIAAVHALAMNGMHLAKFERR